MSVDAAKVAATVDGAGRMTGDTPNARTMPSQSTINADILDRFLQHQEELADFIDSCADLVDQKQIISSPANRNIVYPLSRAFDIIVAHEQRHLEAADRIRIQILQAVS